MTPETLPHLEIGAAPRALAEDFAYLWLKYVTGVDLSRHCLPCLFGVKSRLVGLSLAPGARVLLDEDREPGAIRGEYLYLCAGSRRRIWADNLHLAVVPACGEIARVVGHNGTEFAIRNARALPIPELPPGYNGLDGSFTRCRNYRFAVAYFGQ